MKRLHRSEIQPQPQAAGRYCPRFAYAAVAAVAFVEGSASLGHGDGNSDAGTEKSLTCRRRGGAEPREGRRECWSEVLAATTTSLPNELRTPPPWSSKPPSSWPSSGVGQSLPVTLREVLSAAIFYPFSASLILIRKNSHAHVNGGVGGVGGILSPAPLLMRFLIPPTPSVIDSGVPISAGD